VALAVGAAAGFVAYPTFLWMTSVLGLAAGLSPRSLSPPAWDANAFAIILVLSPVLEELLHRGLVLGAVRRTALGAGGAVLVSSASFAVTHGEPWAVLGTFLVGLALGSSRVAGASLPFCMAVHAGLNAAALSSAWRWAGPWWLLAGVLLWLAGLGVERRSRAR